MRTYLADVKSTYLQGVVPHFMMVQASDEDAARLDLHRSGVDVVSISDWWAGRFAPAALHNAGGGQAMYRRCLRCNGHALEGSESAHVRWCDRQGAQHD